MFMAASITIYSYMRQYEELGKDSITIANIWRDIARKVFPMIGGFIFIMLALALLGVGVVLVGFIVGGIMSLIGPVGIFIGILLVYIPALLIMASVIMFVPSLVIGNLGMFDALSRMFELYSSWKRWGQTMGIVVVMYLINYALNMALTLVIGLVMGSSGWLGVDFGSVLEGDYIAYLGSTLALGYMAFAFFLVVASQVITGIQYYNLAEALDHTGSQRMIDQIGQDE
jgi:hypothetical protein